MCGTKTNSPPKSRLTLAIEKLYAANEAADEQLNGIILEAKLLERDAEALNARVSALLNTIEEKDRIIVNLEARLAEASQAIQPLDDDLAPMFGLRDVDTSGNTETIAPLGQLLREALSESGHPSRRGRVAIEALTTVHTGSFCGRDKSSQEWLQIEVVDAGGEADLMRFLKEEGETRELRAVTLLEAL